MRGSSRADYLKWKQSQAEPRTNAPIAHGNGVWYDNGDGTYTDSITGVTIDGSDYGLEEETDYTQYILWGVIAVVLILALKKK